MKIMTTTLLTATVLVAVNGALAASSILGSLPASPTLTVSTVPTNGDVNPYGVAFVPNGFPRLGLGLEAGDILVSNFNNFNNVQGTGSTIVRIANSGAQSGFFQGPVTPLGPLSLGLSTALGALQGGFVLVGNVPTTDGTCNTIRAGSLLVIDRAGHQVSKLVNGALDGPWDLVIHDEGERAQVFVSDVLNGTVFRLDLRVSRFGVEIERATQIGSGYGTACSAAAVVVGPTGLAYDALEDVLYVASTADNEIFAIPEARAINHDSGRGALIYQDNVHLHGPLGLVLAPNGDLITANGDAVNTDATQPSELVEFTKNGRFVAQLSLDPGTGGAFGLAIKGFPGGFELAAVDDNINSLDIWIVNQ